MKRKVAWIAMCVSVVGGAALVAQQPQPPMPFGSSNVYGLPGFPAPPTYPYAIPPGAPMAPPYPLPPTGPIPPTGPTGRSTLPGVGPYQPMPPGGPSNGYFGPNPLPMPVPPDPRLPIGQRPPMLPKTIDGGPRNLPAEPYYVQPESPETLPRVLPPARPENPGETPLDRFIQTVAGSGPSEPYTTYEGARYPAELRNDNTNVWVQASFIHWWVRRDNTPPLVTTGNAGNPTAGTLGNNDTAVLLGGSSINPRELSGIQATLGMWLDPERLESLELGGFWLGKASRQYNFASDPNGSPPLGQPVLIGGAERVLLFAQPGVVAGNLAASAGMDFHGLEVNVARNVLRIENCSFDYLVGARYMYLNDFLSLNQNLTVLAGGAGILPFNNVFQPAGANFTINDSFNITNRFYGGTIGARFNYTWCRFDVGATLKVSLGATHTTAIIDGSTTLAGTGTLPGGSLAQPSNIGRFTTTNFSAVPEANLTAGYLVAPWFRVLVGYDFLYWNRIQRAGGQIDRGLDLTQTPSSPTYNPGSVGAAPRYPATRSDFWAQGINVGIELRY